MQFMNEIFATKICYMLRRFSDQNTSQVFLIMRPLINLMASRGDSKDVSSVEII